MKERVRGDEQAEIHAKSKGLLLVGVYVGNKGLEDVSIPHSTAHVAEALKREFGGAVVVVVSCPTLNLKFCGRWSLPGQPSKMAIC